jgi:hypothetical protein
MARCGSRITHEEMTAMEMPSKSCSSRGDEAQTSKNPEPPHVGCYRFGKGSIAVVVVIVAGAFLVHNVIANDTIHYFSEQPLRLWLVAAIGVVGGVTALIYYRLSSKIQRRLKLFTLGSAAGILTLFGCCLAYGSVVLQFGHPLPTPTVRLLLVPPLCVIGAAGLLWFEFYQLFRRQTVNNSLTH